MQTEIVVTNDTLYAKEFMRRLNEEPDESKVRVNKHANNTRYLPITYLEELMDDIFNGLWSTSSFEYRPLGAELSGSILVKYYHPVFKVWITRSGAASVVIRTRQREDGLAPTIDDKIRNALTLDVPHLKAQCVRNGIQSIGRVFGRDLNRSVATDMRTTDFMKVYKSEIDAIDTLEGLTRHYYSVPTIHRRDDEVVAEFARRKSEIMGGQDA